ncbi:MAG: transposase, partial [Solirubrobacterales bacterium]
MIGSGTTFRLRQYCAGSALGAIFFRGLNRSFITSLRPAHSRPRETGGLVGGLHPWDLPNGRHPSYAASICCRFRTFTLRIHGYLQASHNHSERALRGIAVGRRAWLFFGSDDHASAAANLLSLIASCELHRLDPET